jgi:hypothetical protein
MTHTLGSVKRRTIPFLFNSAHAFLGRWRGLSVSKSETYA